MNSRNAVMRCHFTDSFRDERMIGKQTRAKPVKSLAVAVQLKPVFGIELVLDSLRSVLDIEAIDPSVNLDAIADSSLKAIPQGSINLASGVNCGFICSRVRGCHKRENCIETRASETSTGLSPGLPRGASGGN